MRRRSWAVAAVIVLALVVVLIAWFATRGRAQAATYRTETVQRGNVRVQVSATGTLNPVMTVQVGSQISGTIAALYADFNSRVKAGEVLAQLDPTFLEAQVAQNGADLEKTVVALRQAERDFARIEPLQAQGLASMADIDAAQSALEAARASVKASQAALARAETNLRYATIRSPIDGVVVSRNVDVGQTVAASLSAPTLYLIANDLSQMQLEAWVDEADIGRIRMGLPVTFTVDAFPDETFRGEVREIRLAPRTEQNVVSYTVIVTAQNPEQRLLPGMTANATVLVDEARDALRIPSAALRFRPDGASGAGRSHGSADAAPRDPSVPAPIRTGGSVYILQDGRPQRVAVSAGLNDGMYTAVTSDSLIEGAAVIVGLTGGAPPSQGTVNPFAPTPPGGMRGGRR